MAKKILIDARMYGLENTGIGRYLIKLIANLQDFRSDFEYMVLLRKKYFQLLEFPDNWKKVKADISHYSLSEQTLLPAIIDRLDPDLVHFPHLNVPYLYKGKFVMTLHDMTMHRQGPKASKLPKTVYLLKRGPFLFTTKKAMQNAVKIITPSFSVATDVCNNFGVLDKKVAVIHEGSPEVFLNSYSGGELSTLSNLGLVNVDYFLYIGNAYPHKNLEMAIKAVKDLNTAKNISVKLVLAGNKDFFVEKLEKYVKKEGCGDYVVVLGFIKDIDLPALYKNSIGFVYPSLSEGFGLQGLEAIAYGTTLLCSNIAVFKEIFETHAFYFDPASSESISGTMFSVFNLSKGQRNQYLRKAQGFISKYSWKQMAQETLEVYKSVL